MEKFISGEKILSSLNIEPFQLVDLVERGPEPHDQESGLPITTLSVDQWSLRHWRGELELLKSPGSFRKSGGGFQVPDSRSYEQQLADCRKHLAGLEAKGVSLPKLEPWEWSACIVLHRSKEAYKKLSRALYRQNQLLALRGNLPYSCPNQQACSDVFHQRFHYSKGGGD